MNAEEIRIELEQVTSEAFDALERREFHPLFLSMHRRTVLMQMLVDQQCMLDDIQKSHVCEQTSDLNAQILQAIDTTTQHLQNLHRTAQMQRSYAAAVPPSVRQR